jgi:hypothetical protein
MLRNSFARAANYAERLAQAETLSSYFNKLSDWAKVSGVQHMLHPPAPFRSDQQPRNYVRQEEVVSRRAGAANAG